MRKKNVMQYLPRSPIRLQPGIVRECCEQACPLYEIGRYCSDSPGTYVVARTTNATVVSHRIISLLTLFTGLT